MIDVVAVLRPEDVVVDFLSVLDPARGREVHLLVADRGAYLKLPVGVPLAGRLAPLADLLAGSADGAKPYSPGAAADAIALETGDVEATVWTHNPADRRERRGRWGLELADLVRRAPVLHAVGDAHWFQWITDVDERLSPSLIESKLDFVNTHGTELLSLDEQDDDALLTSRVHSVERFFGSTPDERARLYAVMGGRGEHAALVSDPWEFATSPYEVERLDAVLDWVRSHLDPAAGRVIEVGACEGALTRRLLAEGYSVDATEPNQAFLERLRALTVTGPGDLRVHPHSYEDLTTTRRLTGSAYLLIELLYYEQDLALLDRFPTDRLFVAMDPTKLAAQSWPSGWSVEEQVELAGPRFEPVVSGRAHLRKRGSRGVLLRRR
ncbi:SAM-dependent methyltransferase [Kribbella sp. CA-253562]|uniref:SAM-dependent methyltransferase n=1 Tax=Kribbella sp. CA-253562 TaxID=3239942 RepID=UPI003D92A971